MPRFAANLSMLFTEHPFLDRFEHAARAGFRAVECLFPYAHPIAEIRRRLDAHDLRLVLHNMPPGDWDAGERGIACLPDRVDEFRAGVTRAVEYATALGVPRLHAISGKVPPGADLRDVHETYVGNLRHAAAELKRAGLTLLIEPINTRDIPGIYLNRTAQALAVIDEVGADNLKLQYDLYHAQRSEGELIGTLTKHADRIGHIQLADNPGRGEPYTGEIGWDRVFAAIDAMGYTGWIGCEYKPATTTDAGLGWLARAARAPTA